MTYIVEDQKEPERVRAVTLWEVNMVGPMRFLVGAETPEGAIYKARQWVAENKYVFTEILSVEQATGVFAILI
jgi:hypothetical protein